MAITIGKVEWPGLVGIGAGLVKGAASFLDYGRRAAAVEVGSITRELCQGNQGQTVWKYGQESALRHNAGMPNPGAVNTVAQLKEVQYQVQVPWGLNVAVSPGITDTKAAAADAAECVEVLLKGGLRSKWLTLNVSSPDTNDPVVMLSEPGRVWAVINAVKTVMRPYGEIPVWVKLAVGLPRGRYYRLAQVMMEAKVEAMVIANALTDPRGLPGGWCGTAVRARSVALAWKMRQLTYGKIPTVGVGGILRGKHVEDRLEVGVSAVMVVSAVLFRGRDAVAQIMEEYGMLPRVPLEPVVRK